MAGWTQCGFFRKTVEAITGLTHIFPSKISLKVIEYNTKDEYMNWLVESGRPALGPAAVDFKTSPIVWFDDNIFLGGRDDTIEWCRKFCSVDDTAVTVGAMINDNYSTNHGFDYDVVVIGGGSGGLACSKEAKKYGANVAVLDYVRPSIHGTKWGLGGTCVNVGCIPKKLMHTASLLGEHMLEARGYGWSESSPTHSWENMKESIQDHIKGLNFGYRVQLREAGVTYLNKLGKFVGPNQLECRDVKGNVQVITAARFVVAVGGRPSLLQCPGGELAISSDDLFSLSKAPGKTLVVGAGYVSLECAGFLAGLKQGDVTVAVRSILLRGFDEDCVAVVKTAMEAHTNLKFKNGVPSSITKNASGKLLVTFAAGDIEEFDTVLAAVGRDADIQNLGLDTVGVNLNAKSGKIPCQNEQTSVPHIYAIGDVIHGGLELTPVAILAGKLLARRLFGGMPQEFMKPWSIATTVFTPLEFGTVGYSEAAAIDAFGAENVDCYISNFQPLEWSIAETHGDVNCYSKIVVDKTNDQTVLGMHIVAPNAGEIIQGFAVALAKGIKYSDLQNTVGIHPTIAEEFTVMSISKSSGESASKTGC